MRYIRSIIVVAGCCLWMGCNGSDGQSDSAAGQQQSNDFEILPPSTRTIDEAIAFIKPQTTTDELHEFLKTTPALVRPDRFHWRLKDGSLWTDFDQTPTGAVIVSMQSERGTNG